MLASSIFSKCTKAAHAASPATSQALLAEPNDSRPRLLRRISKSAPGMAPKAYRWVGEMEEISEYVGENEGDIHEGMANLYRRVENSLKQDGREAGDVSI